MLSVGQASDLCGFDGLAPQIKSDTLIADKGYDADERVRGVLAGAGKKAVIPPRSNRNNPAEYDKELYRKRHAIENFFSRLKDFRGIATRFDKTGRNFLAGVYLAASILWLN
jgi:transposase